MLMSMTGFGKTTGTYQSKKVSIEIRSLNSKSLDLNVRTPPIYRELELAIRNIVSEHLDRGKVDVNVNLDSTGDTKNFTINKDLAKAYYADLKAVNEAIGESTEDYLALILRMPDIYVNEREELSDEEKAWVLELMKDACVKLNEFRRQEGIALENEFTDRIEDIFEKEFDEKYILTPKLWEYLFNYSLKHKAKGNGFGYGLVGENDVSRTLSARYYKDGSEILIDRGYDPSKDFHHPLNLKNRPRRLTPRECARLMGYDKASSHEFNIPVSDTQAYKQFGNSVVVPVFAAVAKLMKPHIKEAIDAKSQKSKKSKVD